MCGTKSEPKRHDMSTADQTVEEARVIVRKLVERQKPLSGNVEKAWYDVSAMWGLEFGTVYSLWKRPSRLTSIKGHVLDRLRQIDHVLQQTAERRAKAYEDVAEEMERDNHPAAPVARLAASLAKQEAE